MRSITTLLLLSLSYTLFSQMAVLRGVLQDPDGAAVEFANVALFNAADSSLYKVETTDEAGVFKFKDLRAGTFFLKATYLGLNDLYRPDIQLESGNPVDLGILTFASGATELAEVTVTATRALVEVRPDRMVFNVAGTINSVGSDAISLLRKAPSVTVDNNNNITVLGRSGVLLYVDGKRLPLTGDDLSNYLENLPADQIDRIEIITNPGARYEAEGNAGILDIRLKKDKSIGANGSVSTTYSQGRYHRANVSSTGNYRNRRLNAFGTLGGNYNKGYMDMDFLSYQNGLVLDEINNNRFNGKNYNYRLGTDFFLSKKHTIGFLVSGGQHNGKPNSYNRIALSDQNAPENIDSILVATSSVKLMRRQQTYNVNYRFDSGKGRTLNFDLDYGKFQNETERYQPNRYYDATETEVLTEVINSFDTPTDIDIYSAKLDFEDKLLGGIFGAGAKLTQVVSDNTFLFYDELSNGPVRNDFRSNLFDYDERVYAGYVNFVRELGKAWNMSVGLRAEHTDATGMLEAFRPELQEPPVEFNYLSWFPSGGLTWKLAPKHTLALNYGRRINRPDYDVLNPFNDQISQLSYRKGNPFLRPEIVNNLELGYTLAFRYNFKLAYSRTTDQITRLIAPDDDDPRAGFVTWANLADQTIISFNASIPVQIAKKWNAYFNVSASHLDNQADYGDGAIVDVQAFTYNIYQQHTFDLPAGFKGEISGYYSGPGVWGGVFLYESSWSLDLGLQRKFLQDRLNVRLGVSDLFFESGWDGYSEFNGLLAYGSGNWDSRRVSLSLSYQFGNQNIKSRRRQTGIEAEAGRISE
ncbi:MAG: TonB-dependent receptor [Lewinellaceae bacterium]|nr:TonB-dependent receptor [Saprospiraceae bacterium]MCB9330861.1 TonB-dependent receptor [Lewinellaceae bacterium]